MTFRDVAIKNFKANVKKYFAYFLCSSFSIMIFFIYSSLIFNEDLSKKSDDKMLLVLFYIALTALTAFSMFFINYAQAAFIKARNKEFGLYLTLGMTSIDLRKIINVENIIIILSSFLVGLTSGVLFSRLFQMVVLKLLNINNVSYSLNYKSFILTIAVFFIIFLVVIAFSSLKARKFDIADLFKEEHKKKGNNKKEVLKCLVGIFLMLISLILLLIITKNEKLRTNSSIIIPYVICSFVGTYMIISYIGMALINVIKDSNYYFKNILSIKEINHKFNQNKKIIFILSILSSMTITLGASSISLYSLSASIAEMNRTNNVEFVQLGDINNISQEELSKTIKTSETKVKDVNSIEFIALDFQGNNDINSIIKSKPVVSVDIYNSVTGLNVALKKGESLNIITTWMPGYNGIEPTSNVKLSDGTNTFTFNITDSIHSKWIATADSYSTPSGLVISNEEYNNIKKNINSKRIGSYKGVIFDNWKKTGHIVDELTDELNRKNSKINGDEQKFNKSFKLISTIKFYEDLKQKYSVFIFVTTVMGCLFFIAGGSVLFFKQYTELNNDKLRFLKLYRIGISEKEAINIVSKELRITFFIPLIMGSLLGYSFIYLFTFIFGGGEIIRKFMFNATFVVFAYFLFQMVFYYITKRRYSTEIIKALKI